MMANVLIAFKFKSSISIPATCVLFVILMAVGLGDVSAQVNQQELPNKTRILFLLDASGSMLAQWEGTNRITAAKRLLSRLVDSLKVNDQLELALRVYGHQFNRRLQNCKDTKLEVGFNPRNHDLIKNRLAAIIPKGTTPLAYSLEQAATDFPEDENVRNIVIIITDGIESCDGDPCAISLALQRRRVFLKPFIIGLGMNQSFSEEFSCLGKFIDATNIRTFRRVLNRAVKQTLDKTTISVELLDEVDRPNVSNVNVSFINNMTKTPAYNFVHYRDQQGKPDSVEIDGVLSYDLQVNTIPPIYKRDIAIKPGRHNVFRINAPQGNLQVYQEGHSEYKEGVKVLVRRENKAKIINVQGINSKDKYLIGKYDLEILTLPKIILKGVAVTPDRLNKITIANPGVLNLYANVTGFGSLYKIDDLGRQVFVKNLDDTQTRFTLAIQPGSYKLVFRAKNAFGSKYTTINNFEIKAGSTTNIKLIGG